VGTTGRFMVAGSSFRGEIAPDDSKHSELDGYCYSSLSIASCVFLVGEIGQRFGWSVQPIISRGVSPAWNSHLSALQGQAPQVTFNAREFFRLAYYSPVTAELENNVKIVANNYDPNNREAFYARFIGVGIVMAAHNFTWNNIYKSQLLLLAEMNRKGIIPPSAAKVYYDNAVSESRGAYSSYSFEQWLEYLKREQLIVQYPSQMLDLTHRGKDLLKYLAHWGLDIDAKRL
jgi:hypothetical protein